MSLHLVCGFLLLVVVQMVYSRALSTDWMSNLKDYDDKNVFFESDMILQKHYVQRAVNEGSIVKEHEPSPFKKWVNGVVPYVIDDPLACSLQPAACSLTWNTVKHIKNAMRAWSKKTCIKFRKRKAQDKDYVYFTSGTIGKCASHIGRQGGRQNIYLGLGCRSDATIMHEIGHTLGFFHEQSRPDRDRYVEINWNNIPKKYWYNFQKYTTGISDMGTPYDYDSIMHFQNNAYVKTWMQAFAKSIVPLKSGAHIGQRERLSPLDIKEMNLYYNCL